MNSLLSILSGNPTTTTADSEKLREINVEGKRAQVAKILIHPIKSCRGTSVDEARYTPEGLENDRIWSIISVEKNMILTAREVPKMVLISPRVEVDLSSPHGGRLEVSFPDGSGCETFSVPLHPTQEVLQTWDIINNLDLFDHKNIDGYICQALPTLSDASQTVSSILSKYFERPVHLVFKGPRARICDPTFDFPELEASLRYQDGYPLLLLSEESVTAAENEVRGYVGVQGVEEKWKVDKLVIERFRPNIVLRGGGPFAEDVWEEIRIGSDCGIRLVSKCARCLLPNVHPETGIRDKAVPFKVLMKFRTGVDPRMKMKACMGVNGVPTGSGVVKVGEWVEVKKLLSSS